ncbi:hypothetical protein [Labrenzia sp. PHM005]|uniref:hypothetical protein n=1 Tax=Labrenzia sp. PHM005 TaxID=2590016 RepID=UPI00114053E0|nr:hypothetical protein [Labrenzia sp. PHM005]QDG78819.1 hypothetical protein FJ695_24760 [Labrenzia sp. PHM005]
MSVFSILNKASQQQFNLRLHNGAQPQPKSQANAEALVTNLTGTSAPLSEKENETAQSLLKDFTEATRINGTLVKSVKDSKDAMRKEKLERIEQRIKQLKEMMRFATPEQAKRLLKELKQISKEFSSAAKDLNKAAENLGSAGPNSAVTAAADAFSSVIDSTLGNQPASAAVPATSVATGTSEASPQASSTHTINSSTTTETSPEAPNNNNSIPPNEDELSGEQQKEHYKAAIYAYADQQHLADKTHHDQRVEGMRAEHEDLRKIAQDLKMLANWLEALADKDDEDQQDDLKEIKDALKAGNEDLNDPALQETLGVGLTDLAKTSTGPATSSISIDTSVSIKVSNIVV